MVEHKLPIFAIQFLNTGEVWLMAKPEDFTSISEYINTGKTIVPVDLDLGIKEFDDVEPINKNIRKISSSGGARNKFYEERDKKYDKTKRAK